MVQNKKIIDLPDLTFTFDIAFSVSDGTHYFNNDNILRDTCPIFKLTYNKHNKTVSAINEGGAGGCCFNPKQIERTEFV